MMRRCSVLAGSVMHGPLLGWMKILRGDALGPEHQLVTLIWCGRIVARLI